MLWIFPSCWRLARNLVLQMQMAIILRLLSTRTRFDLCRHLASGGLFRHQKKGSYAVLGLEGRLSISSRLPMPSNRMARANRNRTARRRRRGGSQARHSSRIGRTGRIGSLRMQQGGRKDTNDERVGARQTCIKKRVVPSVARTGACDLKRASIRPLGHPGCNLQRDSPREWWLTATSSRGILNSRAEVMFMDRYPLLRRRRAIRLRG